MLCACVYTMSMRRSDAKTMSAADQLRSDIQQIKVAAAETAAAPLEADAVSSMDAAAEFEALTETEKSAATLGVQPNEWRPISWMNNSHYTSLLKKNAIGGRLTQQIEAYKIVSQ